MPQLRRFNPNSTTEGRAVQSWLILIGQASNRQTITYLELSNIMFGNNAAGVLDKILGRILTYCRANKIPGLPVIVVGKGRGTPGGMEKLYSKEHNDKGRDVDEEREAVYEHPWYDMYPPTEDDLIRE
jgi:hypothetical protein